MPSSDVQRDNIVQQVLLSREVGGELPNETGTARAGKMANRQERIATGEVRWSSQSEAHQNSEEAGRTCSQPHSISLASLLTDTKREPTERAGMWLGSLRTHMATKQRTEGAKRQQLNNQYRWVIDMGEK